jgi:twitching motility protein PilT
MSQQGECIGESVIDPKLRAWLLDAAREGASDVHLVAGHPPMLRLHGCLQPVPGESLTSEQVRGLLLPCAPPHVLPQLEQERNTDFALQLERDGHLQRFRVNIFLGGNVLGGCFRIIPDRIPTYQWAGFPTEVADRLAHFRNGLVLVSGVTGSGKTTTLAMIIHQLNQQGGYRIITVEDPVEYVFPRVAGSVITQREVGQDVHSFADGLKYGVRQDPDVILVGEIRDQATGQMALSAAETGHLVFSTLHTRDAKGAISRFADLFPQNVQSDIRSQLSLSLRAVISQHLLPSREAGGKRVLALEILITNSAIASSIRVGKIESIDNHILTGRSDGMLTLNESIRRLWQAGRISLETAEHFVTDRAALR